jgi:hypothetical protein
LRRQANAEKEPKAEAAFIEAHNAMLSLAEMPIADLLPVYGSKPLD